MEARRVGVKAVRPLAHTIVVHDIERMGEEVRGLGCAGPFDGATAEACQCAARQVGLRALVPARVRG